MIPLAPKVFLTIFLLSSNLSVLAQQTSGRNLTVPTTTTSTAAATPAGNAGGNGNNSTTLAKNGTTTTNGNGTTTNNNSNSGNSSSTTTKLTPIPDATGSNGSIPAPAASGGKANGPYGPDDQYIASAVGKLIAPTISSVTLITSTMLILKYRTIF